MGVGIFLRNMNNWLKQTFDAVVPSIVSTTLIVISREMKVCH